MLDSDRGCDSLYCTKRQFDKITKTRGCTVNTDYVFPAQSSPDSGASRPTESERSVGFVQLNELLSEYWARVDRLSTAPVSELYAPSGEMRIGSLHKAGRTEIAQFFKERNESEILNKRNTRHTFSNVRVEWINAGRVIVLSLVIVYAAIGEMPLATVTAPATIADFTDICVRDDSGSWKIESKTANVLFTGAGAANFVR